MVLRILREVKPVSLKGNHSEYSLEGLILKLMLQYFGSANSLEKSLRWERLKAEESIRGWDVWIASPMQWTWTWENFGRRWETGRPRGHKESQTWPGHWATTELSIWSYVMISLSSCFREGIRELERLYFQKETSGFCRIVVINLICCCHLVLSVVQFFCDSMDGSVSGSSVHGISQVRILEWVTISFSRGST